MNIDKPLDEIISSRPKSGSRNGSKGGRRGGRPGAKAGAIGGSAQSAAVIAASNRNKPLVIPGRSANTGSKIILSNLPFDVTEAQVKELFSTTIGPLRRVAMSYRANGQSTGGCTVEFAKADDAARAYTQYNNRLIDGKKPLKVEVVVDPSKIAAAAPANARAPRNADASASRGRGAANGREGRGRGRGGRGGREARPKKTIEDLDAEMEDYAKQSTAAATDASAPAPAAV